MNKGYRIIVGVYNADGGILGELTYIFKKITKQTKCSFCDLTHSNIAEKSIWK